jgi:hypothetical protein
MGIWVISFHFSRPRQSKSSAEDRVEMVVEGGAAGETAAAYALVDVQADRALKKPAQIERLLSSAFAWGDLAPLTFLGTSDGALHCYVPAGGEPMASLQFHAVYKKAFHPSAQFLDSWGVYATLVDAKIALYALPLQTNAQLNSKGSSDARAQSVISLEDSKGAVLLAAHEGAKVLCCLTKQNTLKIYDWTVNSVLEARAQHELSAVLAGSPSLQAALPVQRIILMGESHALLLLQKKEWCVVNLDSGRVLQVRAQDSERAAELETISAAVELPSRHLRLRQHGINDVFLGGKHSAVLVSLCEASGVDENPALHPGDPDAEALTEVAEYLAMAVSSHNKLPNLSDDHARVRVDVVLEYNLAPRNAYYHHPFLLLDQGDRIAVHNIGSMRVIQTLPIKSMYSACAAISVPSMRPKTQTGRRTRSHYTSLPPHQQLQWLSADNLTPCMLIVSPTFSLQMLQMQPIAHQLQRSTALRRLDDAVALCKLCNDECAISEEEERQIYADYAFELFGAKNYGKAMAFFLESQINVMEVVALFPRDLLPRKVVATQQFSLSKARAGDHGKVGKLDGEAMERSLLALTIFLRWKREAELRELEVAKEESSRSKVDLPSTDTAGGSELELIDTMLVKCLVLACESTSNRINARAEQELMDVVNSRNACDIGEIEIFLRAHRRYEQLLAFYSTRKLYRKALELLEDLERNTSSSPATSPTSMPGTTTQEDSLETVTAPDYLVLTTEYLRRLGKSRAELVFEFSRRVIYIRPALGLSIFTQRRVRDRKEDIDSASILQHLKTCQISTASSSSATAAGDNEPPSDASAGEALPLTNSRFLAIEYLTQTIYQGRLRLPSRLHDEAAYLLLDAITAETSNTSPTHAAVRLASRVSSQRGFVGRLRRKLLQFLESDSSDYHPERMLSRTPTEMVDERAALLSKLGRHHEVLQLYALELKDASLAEAYCNRCFKAKTADSEIYTTLLRLYLRPSPLAATPSGGSHSSSMASSPPKLVWQRSTTSAATSALSSEAVTAAISVLNKYAERIDVPTVLDLLPPDVPAASLGLFFRRVLERQVEQMRNGQVKKQLAKIENFRVREVLSTKRKGSVTVWSSHCCQMCGKKLGVGTFVRLPNGALLHYSCQPSPHP